jgi:hypothetical protein
MNTLETLKALVAQLEAEKTTTPKPRCDAQGRLLEVFNEISYWMILDKDGAIMQIWNGSDCDYDALNLGKAFISKPAAEAELTRLKCLQRLRGMEGFSPYYGNNQVWANGVYIMDGFYLPEQARAAEATITPEERAAFLYREPTKE